MNLLVFHHINGMLIERPSIHINYTVYTPVNGLKWLTSYRTRVKAYVHYAFANNVQCVPEVIFLDPERKNLKHTPVLNGRPDVVGHRDWDGEYSWDVPKLWHPSKASQRAAAIAVALSCVLSTSAHNAIVAGDFGAGLQMSLPQLPVRTRPSSELHALA